MDLTTHVLVPSFGPKLRRIDGSLRFHVGALNAVGVSRAMFPLLERVGGNLEFDPSVGASTNCRRLTSLLEVGGVLKYTQTRLDQAGASTGLTLGGLELPRSTGAALPLPASVVVRGAGSVVVRDNADLCQCQVDALATELRAAGWTGALDAAGNGTAATCPATGGRELLHCGP